MANAPTSQKAFETILAGRKCYRMSKDNKNQIVWPPHLEAALMEGLDKYKPAESKSPRGLTRFPNRNKFISEFILKKTGEIRTAKQVGSRIQQLRDTSAGKTIMKEISDRHYEMMHPPRSSPGMDPSSLSAGGVGAMLGPQVVHVYISVPPADPTWPLASDAYGQASRTTDVAMLSPSMYQWNEPRSLRNIDPTVTFRAFTQLPLCSSFTVFCGSTVMHVDPPALMTVRPMGESGFLYYATLAPGYWDSLCSFSDLSPYTIVQEITKQGTDASQKPIAVMVIQYHFNTSAAPPLSPFALNEDDLEIDYESDEMVQPPLTHALSTCSESPYPSDRDGSPAYSIPAGFASQPLSPVEWVPTNTWAYNSSSSSSAAAGQTQPPAFQTSGSYYAISHQPQQQQQQQQHASQPSRYVPGY